jgi:hypothetical protein
MDTMRETLGSVVRAGVILAHEAIQPEEARRAVAGQFKGLVLAANIPDELVQVLVASPRDWEQQLAMLVTADGKDHVLAFILQTGAAQLRILMPLSDSRVQLYLEDCARRHRLCLLLGAEEGDRLSVLTVPGRFANKELLRGAVEASTGSPESLIDLVQLSHELCHLDAAASLIEDQPVTSAVSVLVAHGMNAKLQAALKATGRLSAGRAGKPSLH